MIVRPGGESPLAVRYLELNRTGSGHELTLEYRELWENSHCSGANEVPAIAPRELSALEADAWKLNRACCRTIP